MLLSGAAFEQRLLGSLWLAWMKLRSSWRSNQAGLGQIVPTNPASAVHGPRAGRWIPPPGRVSGVGVEVLGISVGQLVMRTC